MIYVPLIALILTLPAQAAEPLVLEKTISLHAVSGRIDLVAIDLPGKRLLVAELGNDSVDVVRIGSGEVLHRSARLSEPQGAAYAECADTILIATAGDGSDFSSEGNIALGDNADDRLFVVEHGGLVGCEAANRAHQPSL